jgi:hypothetical protein
MHEESLIPNPLGIPADSNQLGNPLVPRIMDLHSQQPMLTDSRDSTFGIGS